MFGAFNASSQQSAANPRSCNSALVWRFGRIDGERQLNQARVSFARACYAITSYQEIGRIYPLRRAPGMHRVSIRIRWRTEAVFHKVFRFAGLVWLSAVCSLGWQSWSSYRLELVSKIFTHLESPSPRSPVSSPIEVSTRETTLCCLSPMAKNTHARVERSLIHMGLHRQKRGLHQVPTTSGHSPRLCDLPMRNWRSMQKELSAPAGL